MPSPTVQNDAPTAEGDAVEQVAEALGRGLPELVENIGALGQTAVIGGLIVGIGLLLLGRKIARPICAVCGLVIGAGIAGLAAQEFGWPEWAMAAAAVGGLVSGLLAYFLFRIWMAMSCALMLALIAPAVALIWQGQAPDVSEMEHTDLVELRSQAEEGQSRPLWMQAQMAYEHEKREIVAVWQEMPAGMRNTITVAAGIGALAGLVIGLILPYVAASIQSSLVGAALIFLCAVSLAHVWLPDAMARLPDVGPRGPLLVIGLIAIHGIGIQWTLSRRRADR